MQKIFITAFVAISLFACTNNNNNFTVSGKITNATGKMIYLEEVPIGTMRPTIVDSATLNSDGTFKIETETGESAIYNLRIDHNNYTVASIINDARSVALDVVMNKENNQFVEKYTVSGSPSSESMKTFMTVFNEKMQQIFHGVTKMDSLHKLNTADSLLATIENENATTANYLKDYTLSQIKLSGNPALTMFMLGYYQSTASNPGLGIAPLSNEQVNATIADAIKKSPKHTGIAALQKELQAQMDNVGNGGLVGNAAPDFTLPDVNGNPVALSSFKGKYVLVDFWASWCKPCRMENPNVVAAYNKYKDKNFTILGVSLDEDKAAWQKAIKDDNLAWPHLSDLKAWESTVVPLYRIDGIPFNVLLDPSGKVIAQGLRGADLEAKLAEVLK